MKVYKLYDVVALKKQKKYFDIYMDVYDFFNYEIETYNDTSVVMDDYQTVITSEGSFLRVDIVAEDYEELTPEEILEINPNFNFEELCEGSSLLKVEDGIVSEVLYSFDCDVNDFKEAAGQFCSQFRGDKPHLGFAGVHTCRGFHDPSPDHL